MKLTHKVELSLIIEHLRHIELNESATADAIGKAIADIERARMKNVKGNVPNIIRNVIDDLNRIKSELSRKARNIISQDVQKLNAILKSLGKQTAGAHNKLNPKT